MKKNELIGAIIFIIVLILFGKWFTSREYENYKSNGIYTIGTVVEVKDDYKKVPYVCYSIIIGNKLYLNKHAFPELKANIESELIGKQFSVIYIKDNPEENRILITRAEFKRLNLKFPDSLLWTIKFEA